MKFQELLLCASLMATTAAAQQPLGTSDPRILAHGRADAALVYGMHGDQLVPRMSSAFLNVVGAEKAGRLSQLLEQQIGTETSVVSERAFASPLGTEYYRISHVSKAPESVTVTLHIAWSPLDSIIGLGVTPTRPAAPTMRLDYQTKTQLHLPLATPGNSSVYVAWGGRSVEENYHATASDQRFAYDLLFVKDGQLSSKDPKVAADYACYGMPVLAPAGGTIVQARDSVDDNVPPAQNAGDPTGNYVVIDHGNGEFSLLAHFRRGSVQVHKGDVVKAAQQLAECGNSGNSTIPHVHFHLQTGSDYKLGEGLPAPFVDYLSNGKHVDRGEPSRGEYLRRP